MDVELNTEGVVVDTADQAVLCGSNGCENRLLFFG